METCDGRKKYKQTFKRNMSWSSKPTITDVKAALQDEDGSDDDDDDELSKPKRRKSNAASKSFTKITFSPDLEKFGLSRMEDDLVHLMRKRV